MLIEPFPRSPVSALSSVHCMYSWVYFSFSFLFSRGSNALVGPGLLIVEVSSLHSDTPHSVDRPVAGHCTWQHTTPTRDKHPWPRWDSDLPISATGRPQAHALDRRPLGLAPLGLIWKNSTFCPHSVFICCEWISEQAATVFPVQHSLAVFITETVCLLRGTD